MTSQIFSHSAGLGMIYKNRPVNNRGFSHGRVAIMYQTGTCNFTRVTCQTLEILK